MKFLCLKEANREPVITLWNIKEILKSEYIKKYSIIQSYIDTQAENEDIVIRIIRELLEENLRMRFPNSFKELKYLGDYIGMIYEATDEKEYYSLLKKRDVEIIKSINDWISQFHHPVNGRINSNPINPTQLKTFAEKAINYVTS